MYYIRAPRIRVYLLYQGTGDTRVYYIRGPEVHKCTIKGTGDTQVYYIMGPEMQTCIIDGTRNIPMYLRSR